MTGTAEDASPLTVAVLGTGIMGAAMARNLSRAGHTVHAWNRGRAKAGPLAADGVQVAGTPKEAVAAADAVLTMLFSEDAVAGVISQAGPALRPGAAWVQSTTVAIDGVPRLAPASFAVDTSAKDAHLIVAAARQAGIRLDGAEASAARLIRAAALGHAAEDLAAAYYASFD